MHLILILAITSCGLAAVLPDEEILQEWLKFNQKYGQKHRTFDQNGKGFQNFKENVKRIFQHNKLFEQKRATYKMAVNVFADLDLKEMEKFYMGLKMSDKDKQNFLNIGQLRRPNKKSSSYPLFVDWRDTGAITAVKNQLGCGSCWAFSSSGALEAHYFLKHNKSVILSEQNLVDCVKENFGCGGGWMIPCFDYVNVNGGINPESQYPYEAVKDECRFQPAYIGATCNGYNRIRQDDEQHLLEIVATEGPVAVAIDVNSNFMNYIEGIYDDPECSQMVNHAVLVVGYGTENGQDYWLVKNSWGIEWGDKGYIKMARNKRNQCAIATYGVYPLV